MTTAETTPTSRLDALQRLPEIDPTPDDEAEEPTCLTTGVLTSPQGTDEETAAAEPPDPSEQPAPDKD